MNIDDPFHFSDQGRTATTTDSEHIVDMIKAVLFTRPGTRVNRPDFGAGVHHLVHGPNSPEIATTLNLALQAALQRWLGDIIHVTKLDVVSQPERGKLAIAVHYVERRSGEPRHETLPFPEAVP